jgi:hypothetical protein
VNEDEARLIRLVDWLVGHAGANSGIAVGAFYDNDEAQAATARSDLEALEQLGYARASLPEGELRAFQAQVTTFGRISSSKRRRWREDPINRSWACRSAEISWLYAVRATATSSGSVPWTEFLADDRSLYVGYRFTEQDVHRAAAWLQRNGLIDDRSQLTDRGEDCAAHYAADVQRYLVSRPVP